MLILLCIDQTPDGQAARESWKKKIHWKDSKIVLLYKQNNASTSLKSILNPIFQKLLTRE